MNLKDRLENIRKTNVISIKEDNEKDFLFDIEDVFADSKELRTIITETIASGKNILFVSEPSIDKSLVSKYFSYLLLNRLEDVIVSENLTDEILFSDSRINILPKPSIKEIVKILEYIMYGYKSFVFGMNFATLDNILNKIKTSISINCKGISSEAIETLLSSSNIVIVYLNKNIDGLFYVSKIDKLVSENFITDVVTIIDFQQQKPITKKNKKNKKSVNEEKVDIQPIVQSEPPSEQQLEEESQVDVVVLGNDEDDVVAENVEVTTEVSEIIQVDEVVEQNVEPAIEQKIEEIVVEENKQVEEIPVEDIQNEKTEETPTEVVVEQVKEEKTVEVVNADEIKQEQKDIIAEISKKVNKYKLLKEKAKNKKVDITE